MTDISIRQYKDKVLAGGQLSADEAYDLASVEDDRQEELWEAAREVTALMADRTFDSCSIINARSGRCPEDCKWCAQSAHYATSADCYPLVSREECMAAAERNRSQGIKRFSIVTSGRRLSGPELDRACSYLAELRDRGGLGLCASMGLLGREELAKLRAAGVTRYHCNLEAAPSFFPRLCSTHTVDDKIATMMMAREAGLEVCSGGIIGMGETRRQRVELALELRKVNPCSIPVNILCPIPGTPLEDAAPLSEDEILTTLALFRFVHPRPSIRFAGGRASLSRRAQLMAMTIGVNGAIMGDMLTTVGAQIEGDRALIRESGYDY